MAASSRSPAAALGAATTGKPVGLLASLFAEGHRFDFFQAVTLLERAHLRRHGPGATLLGQEGPPERESVRFRAHQSLVYPGTTIVQIAPPARPDQPCQMTVAFMGLTGPGGALPRVYTEALLDFERFGSLDRDEARAGYATSQSAEEEQEALRGRKALRDWFDLFNHRWISLFYRAWCKYRFWLPYARGELRLDDPQAAPDAFTFAVLSLLGLAPERARGRLRIAVMPSLRQTASVRVAAKTLGHIPDLSLVYYAGLLAARPRSAVNLQALLSDYFGLPLHVLQFQGQWLYMEPANQTRFGGPNCILGENVIAGLRVWDRQGRIRIRVGPLRYGQFLDLLPDRSPYESRKTFFLLAHLTRLFIGPQLEFDVQLILAARDVPACQLADDGTLGPRLGWNTWVLSRPAERDADEAIFEGQEVAFVLPEET